MKRVLYFIGLKIAEVSVVAITLWLSALAGQLLMPDEDPIIAWIIAPLLTLTVGCAAILLFLVGREWVRANWKEAGELAKRY